MSPGKARPAGGLGELLHLAWPTMLSYALNNAYRINDQFWIQGLGASAQAAIGATFFVQVMNFAAVFLAVGGTLALVSRAIGAGDAARRDSFVRHALLFGLLLGVVQTALVLPSIGPIVSLFGLEPAATAEARTYLFTLYVFMAPMVLFPVTDAIFIARGNTRVPMTLQCIAVAMNYVLNPILIYGAHAAEMVHAPGVHLFARIAAAVGMHEGLGMAGAAIATGVARTGVMLAGLTILRVAYGTPILVRGRPIWGRIGAIARISAPVSFSIAVYSGTYWLLLALVLTRFGDAVVAGLGVGFQVFEGLSFPCYLGISVAGAALVGRAIGARDRERARATVRMIRRASRGFGLVWTALFALAGPLVAGWFTADPDVRAEIVRYVLILAVSQVGVAAETANEKILLGAGHTRPQLWIAPIGNALRLPLGWLCAVPLGLGAAGVWWAIDATTFLKASLYWRQVQHGPWLDRALHQAEHEDELERTTRAAAGGAEGPEGAALPS